MNENDAEQPIIICRDVHKWYGQYHALRGINMDVYKGEVGVIFGPSGSGKSTFIRTLNRLEERNPDLILMDINMPDIDGYTLTAQIRSMPALARVPIVAVTANVMRGDREKSLQAGCDGYIQKPIDIDELPRQVERFIRTANA